MCYWYFTQVSCYFYFTLQPRKSYYWYCTPTSPATDTLSLQPGESCYWYFTPTSHANDILLLLFYPGFMLFIFYPTIQGIMLLILHPDITCYSFFTSTTQGIMLLSPSSDTLSPQPRESYTDILPLHILLLVLFLYNPENHASDILPLHLLLLKLYPYNHVPLHPSEIMLLIRFTCLVLDPMKCYSYVLVELVLLTYFSPRILFFYLCAMEIMLLILHSCILYKKI